MKKFLSLTTLLFATFSAHAMEMETEPTKNNPFKGTSCNALVTCASILDEATKNGTHPVTTKQKLFKTLQSCSISELREIYQNSSKFDAPMVGEIAAVVLMGIGQATLHYQGERLLNKLADQLRQLTTEQMVDIYCQSNHTKFAFANHQPLAKLYVGSFLGKQSIYCALFSDSDEDVVMFNSFRGAEVSHRPFPYNSKAKLLHGENIFITHVSPRQKWLILQNEQQTTWLHNLTEGGVSAVGTVPADAVCDKGNIWIASAFGRDTKFLSVNNDQQFLLNSGDQIKVVSPDGSTQTVIAVKKDLQDLAWTSNDLILIMANDGGLYDPQTKSCLLPLNDCSHASYQPDEQLIAARHGEVLTSLWDVRSSHRILDFNKKYTDYISLSKSCRSLAIKDLDSLNIFDLRKPDIEERIIEAMNPNKLVALSLVAAQRQQQQQFPDESQCPESLRGSYRDIVKFTKPVEQKEDKKDDGATSVFYGGTASEAF